MTANTLPSQKIDLQITLKEGTFGETGTNTVYLSGLRVSADIAKAGGISLNESLIRIWGLTPSMMNELSTMGLIVGTQGRSTLILYAYAENGVKSIAFSGDVFESWAEYQGAPVVTMNLKAQSGQIANIKPTAAISYKGAVDVADIMAQLAASMGLKFERNGVSVMLTNPNLPGTDRQKAVAAADAARINCLIDDDVLAIWPKNGARQQQPGDIITLSADTGLVGYPAYNAMGIAVKCLYNPAIRFGTYIKVQSALPQANKTWYVYQLAHNLESELPGGQWFSSLLLTEGPSGYNDQAAAS
ncbi:MAG: hypothetical protein LBH31_07025 [Burkholderiaceae bacterium]|jgi:hypothetical protein|nr:hypothetical protein [Burkholderiaceae bacterium]